MATLHRHGNAFTYFPMFVYIFEYVLEPNKHRTSILPISILFRQREVTFQKQSTRFWTDLVQCLFQILLFWFGLMLNVPVNNFSVMLGRSHSFLDITSTFWGVNMSCSRTQHGDPSGARTPDLWIRSPRC